MELTNLLILKNFQVWLLFCWASVGFMCLVIKLLAMSLGYRRSLVWVATSVNAFALTLLVRVWGFDDLALPGLLLSVPSGALLTLFIWS